MNEQIEQKSKAIASSYLGLFCKKYSCTECDKIDRVPKHDCPDWLLSDQQRVMENYLDILEERAIIENIDLGEEEK